MATTEGGFKAYVRARKTSATFAKAQVIAAAEVRAIDHLVRQLDEARVAADLTKAELARRIGARPEVLRKLFTTNGSNPTVVTLSKIAAELGYELKLLPIAAKTSKRAGMRSRRAQVSSL